MTTRMHMPPTPWGQADDVTWHGPLGMYHTPSHGGFFVSSELRAQMPAALQGYETFGNNGPHWFEEDCDACIVVLAFPQHFTPKHVARAIEAIRGMAEWKANKGKYGPVIEWLDSAEGIKHVQGIAS